MAGRRLFREDFDRGREFVALRAFTFGGIGYVPGQALIKDKFTVRRLRQLFDQRFVGYSQEYKARFGIKVDEGPRENDVTVPESVIKVVEQYQPRTGVVRRRRFSHDVTA